MCGKEIASTSPLAFSAMFPEVIAGTPAHVPLVNQSSVMFPVGVGLPGSPVTLTKSWTVEPALTVSTIWWAAS